jgi:hypothetical protein
LRNKIRDLAGLLAISICAIVVHGYHPYVEDAEIYLPGVKKILNPALYPNNQAFYASHAHLSFFPNIIAGSIRFTHIPFDWAILCWQFVCVFVLLYACWRLGTLIFGDRIASWGGTALVASLLTIPIAGTALYIMDQYLTARSISTATVMMMVVSAVEKKYLHVGLWAVVTALVHPLMVVFGVSYCVVLALERRVWHRNISAATVALLFPLGLFPPATDAYRQVVQSRSYFFLLQWEWYEWLGIFAPLLIFWWYARIAKKQNFPVLVAMCRALIVYGAIFFVAGLILTIPSSMLPFAQLQPLRALHLEYILLFVFTGGLLGKFVLKKQVWRWLLLFVPLCGGMFYASRELFPDSRHLELPNANPRNVWVDTFLWVRNNTPADAFFALDPGHMELQGEDQHGFRAIAERSMLADRVKDSGVVTMFPRLAETWIEQVNAQKNWKEFQQADLLRLKNVYGVNWVVLEKPGISGLTCPYENARLLVCRIE